jgi:transcriptional regulator with XRE-family HTH domain
MNCQANANGIIAKANIYADIMLAMEFKDWVLNWLNKKGWNQAELAARAGVTRTAISDILSGRRNPGPDLCTAIARALNLPPETVFRAAGLLPPVPASEEQQDTLMYLYSQLPQKEREEVLEYIRFKLEKAEKEKEQSRTKKERPAQIVLNS